MNNPTPDGAGWYLDEYDGPRFWQRVDFHGGERYKTDPLATAVGECWLWRGTHGDGGYGIFRVYGRAVAAHRISFKDFGKKLPDDMSVDHLCRTPGCVRPSHAEAVSHRENVSRGLRGHITHCPHGHEYTADNTKWVLRNGRQVRYCVICLTDSKRRTYLKRKAAGKV